jgi:hypothetical protein
MVEPRVLRAMTSGRRAALPWYLSSGRASSSSVVVEWAVVARAMQRTCRGILSAPRSFWGRTAISSAIEFSMAVLARSPFQSDRQVIDVSGDGTNNSGIDVAAARDAAIAKGVTINGLVIVSDEPLPTNPTHTHPPGGLKTYFENNVIGGPGAFVLEAQGFDTFGESIISKLIKEVAALAVPEPVYE